MPKVERAAEPAAFNSLATRSAYQAGFGQENRRGARELADRVDELERAVLPLGDQEWLAERQAAPVPVEVAEDGPDRRRRGVRGHPVFYGWGYGGQMVYVVPDLALTAIMTSDHDGPPGRSGYVRELHALLADGIVPAAERGAGGKSQGSEQHDDTLGQ